MSYNFDNDYIKYIKFRKKKFRKLLRQKRGIKHRPVVFNMRKRKHMLLGVFASIAGKNLKSYNGGSFVFGGEFDYDYHEESYYNVYYYWDSRESTIVDQSYLLTYYLSFLTNYFKHGILDDVFSFNYFTFINPHNDWANEDWEAAFPIYKYRLDNWYAFELFATTTERWFHAVNPLLGSNPALKYELHKFLEIYRGRRAYTLTDRAEWLNDIYRPLHRFFKHGEGRYNLLLDRIDFVFLSTLFDLPPLSDKLKYKHLDEMIYGSHFFTRPLMHDWQRSLNSFFFFNKKNDLNTNIPNLEKDIKEFREFKKAIVYTPEFENLRRLKLYQQNLSLRKDYRKYGKKKRKKLLRKIRRKRRYEIKRRASYFVRGPFYNYWFRRMGYMAFLGCFMTIVGFTTLITLNARPRSYKHMLALKLRAFRKPHRYSKYMNFSVARKFYFFEDKFLLKKKILQPFFTYKRTIFFILCFFALSCFVL